MNRIGGVVLVLALLAGVVWAARRGAPATEVDAGWMQRNEGPLRRILNLPAFVRLEYRGTERSKHPDFVQVKLDLATPQKREPFSLRVSRDGQRVLYEREYELADPFRELREGIRLEGAPALGPADAPLTVVEYVDYTCGYCRKFYLTLEKPLLEKYRDRVRFVYKAYPLAGLRAWSRDAALGAVCAHQQSPEKFWKLHDKFFLKTEKLSDGRAGVLALAREAGLDSAALDQCMAKPETVAAVQFDVEEGNRLGVQGTPSFFFNGRPVYGLLRPDYFFQIVEDELAAAQAR
jgi:predicted DsbA family dithiol-disulfide isomerase